MITQTVKLRYLRMAPRKVRAIADLIRGLSVNEAEAQLIMMRRRATLPILKLLRSAVNAAQTTKRMHPESLKIEAIQVDQGPMLKRHLPRARGVASPIQKKMSHVTLTLAEMPEKKDSRFKMVVEKKKKTNEDKAKSRRKKEAKESEQGSDKAASSKPGFFRR
ncbi:MAG TPA: 50S ribosomal protein L22, partial [Candidatus Paceibacterota bacterium]